MSKNRNTQAAQQIDNSQTTEQLIEQGINEQGNADAAEQNAQVQAELYAHSQAQAQAAAAEPKTATAEAIKSIVESSSNKSNKIRALLALNLKRQTVANLLGIRYQHVRNVELTPLKKGA